MTSQITKVTKDSLLPDSASFREMMCVPTTAQETKLVIHDSLKAIKRVVLLPSKWLPSTMNFPWKNLERCHKDRRSAGWDNVTTLTYGG